MNGVDVDVFRVVGMVGMVVVVNVVHVVHVADVCPRGRCLRASSRCDW